MSWLWQKVQANPSLCAEAVRQLLLVGMVFELLRWTDAQLGVVLSAVSAILTLLTYQASTPNTKVEAKVQREVLHREASGTGIGMSALPKTGDR